MTKTKADVAFPSHFAKDKRLRTKMEPENRHETADCVQALDTRHEKKKTHRTPSPARTKDVPGWSITKIRGGIGTPTLSVKPGVIHLGSRLSRRIPVSGKETKSEKMCKSPGKFALSPLGVPKNSVKTNKAARRKVSEAIIVSASKDYSKLSPTDSSSDCASDENKGFMDALSTDTENSSRGCCGGAESESAATEHSSAPREDDTKRLALGGQESTSPVDDRRMLSRTSLAFSGFKHEITDCIHKEYLREIEELRSENDYLKDEVEELRSEMLEMRDMYMEEDVFQLQELRQQLEQANKTCRILQYRFRKAERHCLRVAQTGQVDDELVRTLEQDVKVAKDVSIRLHNKLDAVEEKRSHLEQENEELQVKLQDLEVAKEVLQAELEKSREISLKKRGARPSNKPDKKISPQPPEDSSDLKCQLYFAKEESALMCKKLTKMVKDNEMMKEELTKYRSLYGDMDPSLTVDEVADSTHTREAEVRVHLKLVEEEANLLSRRIVELEVENRGLRAEMEDMKIQDATGGVAVVTGVGQLLISPSAENVIELQRHLQFVEEEADLLRRSLSETEEQNKLLMNELNRYKSDLPPDSDIESLSTSTILSPSIPALAVSEDRASEASQEEFLAAKLQNSDLSCKVKKLEYENHILLCNLQNCNLSSSQSPPLETDAEAWDLVEYMPSVERKDGPVDGDKNQSLEDKGKQVIGNDYSLSDQCLSIEELFGIRDHAQLITSTIQLLMSADFCCVLANSSDKFLHKITAREPGVVEILEKNQTPSSDLSLVEALHNWLQCLQTQLQALSQRIEVLGKIKHVKGVSSLGLVSQSAQPCSVDCQVNQITVQQKSIIRDQADVKGDVSPLDTADKSNSNKDCVTALSEINIALLLEQVCELQAQLGEAKENTEKTQMELALENQAHHDSTQSCSQNLSQLEVKTGQTSTGIYMDPQDLKGALKDHEEHQLLLTDSYAAVMDLTKQLNERNQWEQMLHDAQNKSIQSLSGKGITKDASTNEETLQRNQLISSLSDLKCLLDVTSFLPDNEVNRIAEGKAEKQQFNDLVMCTDLGNLNQKNWKYLSSDSASLDKVEPFKTWDCPGTSFPDLQMSVKHVQKSYTAPDKTGIRIYFSPPAVRRMERKDKDLRLNDTQLGLNLFGAANSDQAVLFPMTQTSSSHLSSSYEQWLSSLSQQHRELLEGRTGSSGALHTLGISANLSDDMKEMTNCVRQAIRSSSLERKCSKDAGCQTVGYTSTGTQTVMLVSVGLQTESPPSRGAGINGKVWSPRSSSSFSSTRSRQISSTLEKVHGRIDRPCCSLKHGSPKLTRRVASSSKLETSSSSRDRNMWNLPNRSMTQCGSAWARSTTTRDSPVLSGLNDGLSSLFSIVEHPSNMESLCRGDTCSGRQAAGKPSCPSVGISIGDPSTHKCGIMQELFQHVLPAEKTEAIEEPKPKCLPGALIGTDSITKIVNKTFVTLRDESVVSGKESNVSGSSPEDSSCDCKAHTSCFARSSVCHIDRLCKHRLQETALGHDERLELNNE